MLSDTRIKLVAELAVSAGLAALGLKIMKIRTEPESHIITWQALVNSIPKWGETLRWQMPPTGSTSMRGGIRQMADPMTLSNT